MDKDRRTAIIAGVVFIIATVAALAATPFVPDLKAEGYLAKVSGSGGSLTLGALLLLVAAFGSGAIAVVMYPVLKRWNAGLALGAVVFRAIEAALYIVAVVCLLSLLTASRQLAVAGADPAMLAAIGDTLRGLREHAALAGVFAFCLGALCYYVLFFQSRLVPRWLSGWGIVAALLMGTACVMALLTDSDVTGYALLIIPIALQEMVLAVWLIVRGFDTSRAVAA